MLATLALAALLFAASATTSAQQPYFSNHNGGPEHIESLMHWYAIAAMQRPELHDVPLVMVRDIRTPVPGLDGRNWIVFQANAGRYRGDSCKASAARLALGCAHGMYYRGRAYVTAVGRHRLAEEGAANPCLTGGWWILSLIVHELHHAAGYKHGEAMTAADRAVTAALRDYPIVADTVRVHDELKFRGEDCSPYAREAAS